MTDTEKENTSNGMNEQQLKDILIAVGPRVNPPQAVASEIKVAVKTAWLEEVQKRKRRNLIQWNVAASFFVMISIGFWQFSSVQTTSFAQVDKLIDDVSFSYDGKKWLPAGETSFTSQVQVKTGPGSFASITMADGVNLRIAGDTSVTLIDKDRLMLEQGKIYVDSASGLHSAEPEIEVRTPFGIARDIGTQFEVVSSQDAWQVRVREGKVIINDDNLQREAAPGSVTRISTSNEIIQDQVSAHDSSWNWTQKVTPEFNLENKSVYEYLQWVGRETGSQVQFNSEFAKWTANNSKLHGSIKGISPEDSLLVILSSTDLRQVDKQEGVIHIDLR